MDEKNYKTIAVNRQAQHEYFVLEKYEAGIVLTGDEVKSVKNGNVNLKLKRFATVTKLSFNMPICFKK